MNYQTRIKQLKRLAKISFSKWPQYHPLIALLLLVVFSTAGYSQNGFQDIKGYVVDAASGEALPYANVTVKGSKSGTTTNRDGYFIIVNAPLSADTLDVFYIGYANQTVALNEKNRSDKLLIEMKRSLLETEAITVTAEEYQIWKKADDVSQVTFSPMQISSLPNLGEVDIFRSLQLLPGISGANDGSAGLYVRGGTPDQNLVMLDGMTVYHVDHFFGFFSAFNADAVKDVQVYKGGFPAKYGGRLSSVVDLTGKTGDVNKTRFKMGVNLLSANAVFETPLFDKGSFLLSFRRSYSDFIESSLYNKFYDYLSDEESTTQVRGGFGGGRMGASQQEEVRPEFYFYDLNSKISFVPDKKNLFALSFYSGKDNLNDRQELGGMSLRTSDSNMGIGTRVSEEITDWGNIGSSLKWSRLWHDRFNSTMLFAGSKYFSDYDRNQWFDSENNSSGIDDSAQVFRGGGNFASEENNEIIDLTFRIDNEWHLSNSHRLGFGTWISQVETRYNASLNDTLNLFDRKNQGIQSSFYLQDKWKLNYRWDLTLGLRATHYNQTGKLYFEPRVSANYNFTNEFKIKGAWGQYHQYINRITNENILEGGRDFWLIADEDFEPGFSNHYIAGLSYENRNYLFEVEAYYKDMSNLVEYSRRFRQQADYGDLFFFGEGVSRGVEFLAQKKAGALNGWLSYTLGQVEHTFDNLNYGDPFAASHDRRHEFKSVATYSKGRWDFSATWVFASGQPYTSPESQYYLDMLDGESQSYIHVGEKNAYRLPDYHRMDVSVSRHLYPTNGYGERLKNSWDAELGLSVFNLYNNDNIWYRKYDLDVTPVLITDVKMLGITPTLYLKVNF